MVLAASTVAIVAIAVVIVVAIVALMKSFLAGVEGAARSGRSWADEERWLSRGTPERPEVVFYCVAAPSASLAPQTAADARRA